MELRLNELTRDEFGRPHGVIAIDKPAGITSHDLVDKLRRLLRIKQVGHAGALDPFATGVMVLLVGKATKLSDRFLNEDKEYVAEVLFGIATDSADTEGKITGMSLPTNVSEQQLQQTLEKFKPEYTQYVPVFSSVKVEGNKLRVLARSANSFSFSEIDGKRHVVFELPTGTKTLPLPQHKVRITTLELMQLDEERDLSNSDFFQQNQDHFTAHTAVTTAQIRVACSKGTYIRTLAEDIGQSLPVPTPSMLINLRRTRIGKITEYNSLKLENLAETLGVPPMPERL